MTRKLYIKTHGCQMNEYDSARMADGLRAACGLERTDDPEQADVLLLNTCSIREKAQEKVFSQLGVWKALKTQRPDMVIGVGGCVASQEGEALRERAPCVDLVFGPQTLHRLPEMLTAVWADRRPVVDVWTCSHAGAWEPDETCQNPARAWKPDEANFSFPRSGAGMPPSRSRGKSPGA